MTSLLIRADASSQIGSGHVMRCLALAQAWQDNGGDVTFVSQDTLPSGLQDRLQNECMNLQLISTSPGSLEDAKQTIAIAQQLSAHSIVVDGYVFGADYQKWIKDAGFKLLFLDDNGHAAHYYADFVLNQNIHADESLYTNREPYTKLLLGTRYALLRREFWKWRDWKREIPEIARKILITMGGSDPDNVTLKALQALEHIQLDGLEIKVIVGGSNPHYDELHATAKHSRHNIQLAHNVTDMPALMAWADIAVSAGGSTCWELAFMGLPSAIIVLVENQRALTNRLAQKLTTTNLGWHTDLERKSIAETLEHLVSNEEHRNQIAVRGRELVDSFGGTRVVKAMRRVQLHLRLATHEDCHTVFEWANEPSTREMSFSSEPIPWESHVSWFDHNISDKTKLFWIAENDSRHPVGQVRFSLDGQEATISVSLDTSHRGKGYGVTLIKQASQRVLDDYGVAVIHAYIKTTNVASKNAFARAGYSSAPPIKINNQVATHMTLGKL